MDVSGRGVPVDFATADTNTDTNTTATLVSVAGALDAACEPPPVATTVTHNTESSELADEHELACRSGSHASLPPTSTATSPLTQLPPELLDHVLQLVPARERQRAALALTHAVPGFEPALRTLWTHLAVSRYQQIWPLWRKLKEEKRGAAAVRTFAMVSAD
jgi:hypothetical protein